ncbi:acyltransferase family protein [Jiangella gansuensis]|uniref:acyltransferase family protein n=1 Tax=Jiangella gansuensis TaxID=281473 RepID=UPI00146F9908
MPTNVAPSASSTLPPATSPVARPTRDPILDVLRVFGIALVVLQHWLMPVLAYDDSQLQTGNALSAPGAWIVTWVSQVMPFVFIASGAAAAISLRRRTARPDGGGGRAAGQTVAPWIAARLQRLALPVLALAAVWIVLPHLMLVAGLPSQPVELAGEFVGALLWFLIVLVLISSLTPVLERIADRFRGWELLAAAAGALLVDLVRFTGWEPLGYVNVLMVWGAVYQIGIHYSRGRLTWMRGWRAWAVAAMAFGVVALAVGAGPYPPSMIGMPGAEASNMNPPGAVLLALTAGQLGIAMALRPAIVRWARQPVVDALLQRANSSAMTLYLWHTPALVLVAGVVVLGLGGHTPDPTTWAWWERLPTWLFLLAMTVSVLVKRVAPVERIVLPMRDVSVRRVTAATVLVAAGLLGLTVVGFGPSVTFALVGPVTSTAAIAAGLLLLVRWPAAGMVQRRRELGGRSSSSRGVRTSARTLSAANTAAVPIASRMPVMV